MSEIIVKMNDDHIKLKGGEYVQDIVRCKECKYWLTTDADTKCCVREYATESWKADDFCSYGEREGD